MEQALQCFYTDVSVAVPKFRECCCGERDLNQWRQSLIDEPFKPPQRRSLVAGRVGLCEWFAERECGFGVRDAAGPQFAWAILLAFSLFDMMVNCVPPLSAATPSDRREERGERI